MPFGDKRESEREMEEDKMASWNCLMRPMLLQEFPHRNRPTHWNEDGFFRTVVCPMWLLKEYVKIKSVIPFKDYPAPYTTAWQIVPSLSLNMRARNEMGKWTKKNSRWLYFTTVAISWEDSKSKAECVKCQQSLPTSIDQLSYFARQYPFICQLCISLEHWKHQQLIRTRSGPKIPAADHLEGGFLGIWYTAYLDPF